MYSTMRHYADETRKLEASQGKYGESLMKWSLLGLVLILISLLCVSLYTNGVVGKCHVRRRLPVDYAGKAYAVEDDRVRYVDRSERYLRRQARRRRNINQPWEPVEEEPILKQFLPGQLKTDVSKIIDQLRILKMNEISKEYLINKENTINALRHTQEVNKKALENFKKWFKTYCDLVAFRKRFSASEGKETKKSRVWEKVKQKLSISTSKAKEAFNQYFPKFHYGLSEFAGIFETISFGENLITAKELTLRVKGYESAYFNAWFTYIVQVKIFHAKKLAIDAQYSKFDNEVKNVFTDADSIVAYYNQQIANQVAEQNKEYNKTVARQVAQRLAAQIAINID